MAARLFNRLKIVVILMGTLSVFLSGCKGGRNSSALEDTILERTDDAGKVWTALYWVNLHNGQEYLCRAYCKTQIEELKSKKVADRRQDCISRGASVKTNMREFQVEPLKMFLNKAKDPTELNTLKSETLRDKYELALNAVFKESSTDNDDFVNVAADPKAEFEDLSPLPQCIPSQPGTKPAVVDLSLEKRADDSARAAISKRKAAEEREIAAKAEHALKLYQARLKQVEAHQAELKAEQDRRLDEDLRRQQQDENIRKQEFFYGDCIQDQGVCEYGGKRCCGYLSCLYNGPLSRPICKQRGS